MAFSMNSSVIHTLWRDTVRLMNKRGLRLVSSTASSFSDKQGNTLSLSEQLRARIDVRGPLTVAEYMRAVLTSPAGGYYMHRDVLGRQGDFTTSPEITQLFGDMVGIWFVNELNKFHPPNQAIQLVELGPGRGSLTSDVLRVFKQLRGKEGLSVHLVEISPEFSRKQAELLCQRGSVKCNNIFLSKSHDQYNKRKDGRQYELDRKVNDGNNLDRQATGFNTVTVNRPKNLLKKDSAKHYQEGLMHDGTPVFWYHSINEVPHKFSFFLAHEFFDALPIHKFKKTPEGWREILVTTDPEEGIDSFKFIISRSGTPSSKIFMKPWDEREEVELCPEGGLVAQQIATRMEEYGGFALIIDYGHEGECCDTFRAFKRHRQVDPLIAPGTSDLTADVDFSYLRDAVMDKSLTFGPTPQSSFLRQMGIDVRLKVLLESCSEDQKSTLETGYKMIMDSMGERFKFFSFFPRVLEEHLKKFPVAGFKNV